MDRREAVTAQFIEISDIATVAEFTGAVGIVVTGKAQDELHYRKPLRVRRWWKPSSMPDTAQMIEWTLLVERLGFKPLENGQLVSLLKVDIENWRNGNG